MLIGLLSKLYSTNFENNPWIQVADCIDALVDDKAKVTPTLRKIQKKQVWKPNKKKNAQKNKNKNKKKLSWKEKQKIIRQKKREAAKKAASQ